MEKSISDNLINSLDNRNSTEENDNNINDWNNLIAEFKTGGDNIDYFEMYNDDEKYIKNNINMTVNMIYINGIINTPDDSWLSVKFTLLIIKLYFNNVNVCLINNILFISNIYEDFINSLEKIIFIKNILLFILNFNLINLLLNISKAKK